MAGDRDKRRDATSAIIAGLAAIRRRRLIAHGPAFLFIGGSMAFGIGALPSPRESTLWVAFAAVAGGLALVTNIVALICPRCGNPYHYGPRYRNDFTRQCLWCGLRLDGKNADDRYVLKSTLEVFR